MQQGRQCRIFKNWMLGGHPPRGVGFIEHVDQGEVRHTGYEELVHLGEHLAAVEGAASKPLS
jgi:hypothetical protein